MDRKSKIIIALCAVGMAANVWYGITHPQPLPPPTAAQASPQPAPVTPTPSGTNAPAQISAAAPTEGKAVPEDIVQIKSGPVTYSFTNIGGGIAKVMSHNDGGIIDIALNTQGKAPIGALSSGAKTFKDTNYRVVEESESRIVYEAETADHVLVRKEFALDPKAENPHLLNFKLTLTNKGTAKHSQDSYFLYTGASASGRPDEIIKPSFVWNDAGDAGSVDTNTFHSDPGWFGMSAPVLDVQKSFEKLRWAGSMSRFDAMLLINDAKDDHPGKIWSERFLVDHSTDEYKDDSKAKQDFAIHGGAGLPPVTLEPNAAQTFEYKIYLGPKIHADLNKIDGGGGNRQDYQTRSVMMYGWFSPISSFLVWLMRIFHDWFGNWGAAIILLTCCIRTVLWPLQARSNATMKKMALLSPELKKMQEKYKDDPARQQTEMMKMYREYGVNPLGGCLPMLLQIPIFFGFYRVLQSAAELRGQPWFWVKDLSLPDTVWHIPSFGWPLNILPLLMGISMVLQMKLTPQPQAADKTQQKMMAFMPFIFLWISYNFASALALYWTAQNIYNICQSRITKVFQKDPVLTRVSNGGGPPSSSSGSSETKKKPSAPRPGGGGTKSKRD